MTILASPLFYISLNLRALQNYFILKDTAELYLIMLNDLAKLYGTHISRHLKMVSPMYFSFFDAVQERLS